MSQQTVNTNGNQTNLLAKTIEFDFDVLNDWSQWGGFYGSLSFTNKGKSVKGWTIEFDAPFEIYEIWRGDIVSRKGNHYVIKDQSWNKDVDTGETIELFFNARVPDKKITAPSKYVFNGKSLDNPIETPKPSTPLPDNTGSDPDPIGSDVSRPAYNKSTGFFTLNGKLYDANGNEFIPRGVNNRHVWFDHSGQTPALDAIDNIADLGFNANRIVWQTESYSNDATLEKIIQRTIDNKMVPMVELHDFTGSADKDALLNKGVKWWTDRAPMWEKYEKELIINIANEFGNSNMNREDFPKVYKEAIGRIRNAGIDNTLVVDSFDWGKDPTLIRDYGQKIIESDPQKNTMFGLHCYNGVGTDEGKITEALNSITGQKIPLVIGEFSHQHPAPWKGAGVIEDVKEQHIMKEAQDKGIGHFAWAWDDTQWAIGSNWEADSYEELTPWGKKLVFDDPNSIANTAKTATIF